MGGVQHFSSGVFFNGSGQYAQTGINPALRMGPTAGMGMYLRQFVSNGYHMGAYSGQGRYLTFYQSGSILNVGIYQDEVTSTYANTAQTLGFRHINRISPNESSLYLRDDAPQYFGNTGNPPPNSVVIIGALGNNNAPGFFSNIEVAGAWLGAGLSDAQVLALRNAISEMNTTLNRAV